MFLFGCGTVIVRILSSLNKASVIFKKLGLICAKHRNSAEVRVTPLIVKSLETGCKRTFLSISFWLHRDVLCDAWASYGRASFAVEHGVQSTWAQ